MKGLYRLLIDAAAKIKFAGADCLLLCANTLHQFADDLQREIGLPLINVADATANEIIFQRLKKIGLLGTKITMEADFYKNRLNQKGIEVLVPQKEDRDFIHDTIIRELLKNVILEKSKMRFLRIMDDLKDSGAEAIVLGCTEIPLLVKSEDTELRLFDTLQIHCRAAVSFALNED